MSLWALTAPATALADGGAPLLLVGGPMLFLVGQVWIVGAEAVVLRVLAPRIRWPEAFGDVLAANVKSLLQVGILLPVLVSAVGYIVGAALGLGFYSAGMERTSALLSSWSLVLAGWVFNTELVRWMFPYQFLGWLLVSYLLSVRVEARVLDRRWKARSADSERPAAQVSWVINAVSYSGLIAALALIARRYWTW